VTCSDYAYLEHVANLVLPIISWSMNLYFNEIASMKPIIITVDGWSSCGKSTMARQLARELSYVFIDSGAMYRAITLFFIRHQIDLNDAQSIIEALSKIQLAFHLNPINGNNEIWMNGENVEASIREMSVAQLVSQVAAIKEVRDFAVAQQQQIGSKKGIVMDGRDIGTAVFPEAELKIFMTASIPVRVQRRYLELLPKNPQITMDEVKENLENRDHLDSTRSISPLRKADDAVVLDNSHLTQEEQLALALSWAREKISQ
jgi:cytidylate kinase